MGFSAALAAISLISAGVGAYGQVQQQQAQQQQTEFQSKMAMRNADIAEYNAQGVEEEGRTARREAHDAAQQKRLDAARMVASTRAQAGASGSQADVGANLDNMLDTVERGEVDALRLQEAGQRDWYAKQWQGWNMRNGADASRAQANMLAQSGYLNQQRAQLGMLQSGLGATNNYARLMQQKGIMV